MAERVAPAVPDDIWTAEQVAVYFKVTERTLRDWRDRDATFPQPLELPGRALRWYADLPGEPLDAFRRPREGDWSGSSCSRGS